MKKILKVILALLLTVVLIVGSYIAYVFISYDRLPDNLSLMVSPKDAKLKTLTYHEGQSFTLTSWNIGFGAYTQDYGFFMDGGTESRGWSKESVRENTIKMAEILREKNNDFYLIQEVDFGSTRSYNLDERKLVMDEINGKENKYNHTFGVNYDSPYLFYPILKPHGASKAGLLTLSKPKISEAKRISLPIQEGFAKVMDLDRCFTVNRIPITNKETNKSKEFILINAHLSAYTTDPTIVEQQVKKLYEYMLEEIKKGNYVIAGGDFNMDLLGNSPEVFGVSSEGYSWAKSFPFDTIPKELTLIAPLDKNNPVPSCRNADGPWNKETQLQLVIDGFLVSKNIEIKSSYIEDLDFMYSDHNPVIIKFSFK